MIMGCTHYPILSEAIQKEIGDNIKLINAGYYSALYTREYLDKNKLLANNTTTEIEFYSSDNEEYFKEIAKNFFPVIDNYSVKKHTL